MAEPLDPTDRVPLDDLAISTMWEIAALGGGAVLADRLVRISPLGRPIFR